MSFEYRTCPFDHGALIGTHYKRWENDCGSKETIDDWLIDNASWVIYY